MKFEYIPKGVCSRHFSFDINDDHTINSLEVVGGCAGNLTGISRIIAGMKAEDVIKAFAGVDCHGKKTSCPDQIAQALTAYLSEHPL